MKNVNGYKPVNKPFVKCVFCIKGIFYKRGDNINKKLISNILLVLAVTLALMPTYREYKSKQRTESMIKEYKDNIGAIESSGSEDVGVLDSEQGKILKIDKIDIELPIVNGATFENMKDNVATIKNDTISENTNYSIAGHRYLRKGRHFNRLDEVDINDTISVTTDSGKEIYYTVYDKLIVEPNDITVLDDAGKTEVTLITCHPPGISTHRLVIKAEKVSE